MDKLRRLRPSPSMTVALVALFVALGGTAYATVNLPDDSVGTAQLKDSAVTTAKLADRAVTSSKLAGVRITNLSGTYRQVILGNVEVPANGCRLTTASDAGAKASQTVFVKAQSTAGALPAGLIAFADIPSDGVRRNGLCNVTGATISASDVVLTMLAVNY